MTRQSIGGRDPLTGECIAILVDDGVIRSIAPQVSGEDLRVSAAFIDPQVNDYAGSDLNAESITPDLVITLMYRLFAVGVTTFIPPSSPPQKALLLQPCGCLVRHAIGCPLARHVIPFVQVEGPHLSPADGSRDAHPRDQIRPPDIADFLQVFAGAVSRSRP
jgi:N-acetylglucosamine-6-phosphate deacetylase